MEFELAYQSRVAMDRIRFAIRTSEQLPLDPTQLREAATQLLDALDRLQGTERRFQRKYRASAGSDERPGQRLVDEPKQITATEIALVMTGLGRQCVAR